ncbi:MAG: response regulator [Planctomycetota bacterium]
MPVDRTSTTADALRKVARVRHAAMVGLGLVLALIVATGITAFRQGRLEDKDRISLRHAHEQVERCNEMCIIMRAITEEPDGDATGKLRWQLRRHLDEFVHGHIALQTGDVRTGLPPVHSPDVADLFLSTQDEFETLLEKTTAVLQFNPNSSAVPADWHSIQTGYDAFVRQFRGVVGGLDREIENRALRHRARLMCLVALTGIMLLIEIFIVAFPFSEWLQSRRKQIEEMQDEEHVRLLELQRSNKHQADFIARLNRRIRTPIVEMLEFADLIASPDITTREIRGAAEVLRRNGQIMLHSLRNATELTETSEVSADEHAAFDVRSFVDDMIDTARLFASVTDIECECRSITGVPATVHADAQVIRQVMFNVLMNAVQYTNQGYVHMMVSHACTNDVDSLCFEVIDTGCGMDDYTIAALLDPTEMPSSQIGMRSGIGLTVSRRLIESIGGTLDIDSGIGRGTTVRVTVPVSLGDHDDEQHQLTLTSPTPRGGRILLAEDSADSRWLIEHLLDRAGFDVTTATDGAQAVRLCVDAHADGTPFEVILMDVSMPILDGLNAATNLRHKGITGSIIAITPHGGSQDGEKCLESGCDDFITKPIQRESLLDLVSRHVNLMRDRTSEAA